MDCIKFTHDWNGKLGDRVTYFTTFRQSCPAKYIRGREYTIFKNEIPIFRAHCEMVITMPLGKFPPAWIKLDTGYPYGEAIEVFRRMGRFQTAEQCLEAEYDMILLKKLKDQKHE